MSTTAMWLLLAVVIVVILFGSVLYKRTFTTKELALTGVMAASVLLWARTSVGRLHFAITFAMVKVLPLPVTPSRVWQRSPRSTPFTSVSMACGWSPVGW